jgi:hypothetical protein
MCTNNYKGKAREPNTRNPPKQNPPTSRNINHPKNKTDITEGQNSLHTRSKIEAAKKSIPETKSRIPTPLIKQTDRNFPPTQPPTPRQQLDTINHLIDIFYPISEQNLIPRAP